MLFGETLQGKLANIHNELLQSLLKPPQQPRTMKPLAHLTKSGHYGEKSRKRLQKLFGNAVTADQASIY